MNNSISKTLNDFNIQYRNVLELWEKLSLALSTTEQNIVVELTNTDDSTNYSVNIPSINYLSKEVEKLQKLYKELTDVNSNTTIINSDGTEVKLKVERKHKEPNSFNSIVTPKRFDIKANWFFENFLYPLVYVDFDYSNVDIDRVEVTKLIMNFSEDNKASELQYFNDNYLGKDDINFQALVEDLDKNGIEYIVDIDELNTTVKESVYWGDFTVNKIFSEKVNSTVGNTSEIVTRTRIILNTLNYNNKRTNIKYTEKLKTGDLLSFNNSTYKIIDIDLTSNSIYVDTTIGFDVIRVTNKLQYQNKSINSVNIQIPISYNDYIVTFLRPIKNGLVSNFYSPGTAYYTNNLSINVDGKEVTLAEYYRENITDFGQHIYALAKDKQIPSVLGIEPTAPVLLESNFKVIEINKHLTETNDIEIVKGVINEKSIKVGVSKTLGVKIKELELKINTKQTSNLNKDKTQLIKFKKEKFNVDTQITDFNSHIKNSANQIKLVAKPKYRVRGFWDIPSPSYDDTTGLQNIVQFVIQYRYKNRNNTNSNINDLEYVNIDGVTQTAIFSNWIELKSPVRKKIKDNGVYIWKTENVSSGDEININQLDIPITAGEKVEVRIKSVSEAGYPLNPINSVWSNIIIIDFPDDNSNGILDELEQILVNSSTDINQSKMVEALESTGINTHIDDNVVISNKNFKHTAQNIFSGLYDNTVPQSIEDVLKQINTKLNLLSSVEESENYTIQLIDENNAVTNINSNHTTKIFAGYYKDLVQGEDIPMGNIITKIYKLVITNKSDSNLQLESLDKGSTSLYSTVDIIDNVEFGYKDIPVALFTDSVGHKQRKNQFIYCRNAGLNGINLYDNAPLSILYNIDSNNTDSVVTNSNFLTKTLDPQYIYIHNDSNNVTSNAYLGSFGGFSSNININSKQGIFNSIQSVIYQDDDKYLIGEKSTGALLNMLTSDTDNTNLVVDGNTIYSKKTLLSQNSIEIPIVFQFRLTDYYGDSSSSKPIGRIGGKDNITNMSIKKTIGFDIKTQYSNIGFDIEFSCAYKNTGVYIKEVEKISSFNS